MRSVLVRLPQDKKASTVTFNKCIHPSLLLYEMPFLCDRGESENCVYIFIYKKLGMWRAHMPSTILRQASLLMMWPRIVCWLSSAVVGVL
jgi:hypothetical protein